MSVSEAFDVTAVADAVAEATNSKRTAATTTAKPRALPTGWLLKESRSHPGFFYYFFIPTGLASWHPPIQPEEENNPATGTGSGSGSGTGTQGQVHTEPSQSQKETQAHSTIAKPQQGSKDAIAATTNTSTSALIVTDPDAESELPDRETGGRDPEEDEERASKRRKSAAASAGPKEVRVLHILKKHKDSRRPSSWRQAKITSTLEEAKSELESLLEILVEEEGNLNELKATFEELARTESDCSSAKRGGDLGFFGRRKMQPPFEEASFALKIGELTKQVVETSSGVHLILRIG